MIQLLEYLYWIIAALEIYSEASGNSTLRFFTKPLLMIVLILFYARSLNTGWSGMHKMMMAAFAFSWVGDVALMFSGEKGESLMSIAKDPNFFLVGLVGFPNHTRSIHHLLLKNKECRCRNIITKKVLGVYSSCNLYGCAVNVARSIYWKQRSNKTILNSGVLVYSTAIATMVVFAINRHGRVNDATFKLVVLGALLFMVSDSIIAINKFMQPFATAGIFIMVLYIAGQYFIAKGMLAFDEKSR
jgi:uncharacterized membrane protein YhhN